MLTAIIVAGGSSRRMGFDKTFAQLAGKPVIAHTIAAFERCEAVQDIVIVARAERLADIRSIAEQTKKTHTIVPGGEHRQDSVREGLRNISPDAKFVAVHDAARPLVTPGEIERVFAAAREHGAAALAAPVSDTLKRADQKLFVCGSVAREHLYGMQTPQIFARELLTAAYERIGADHLSVTDEASAVEYLGQPVMLVPTETYNFKITFPNDLALAKLVLENRQSADL